MGGVGWQLNGRLSIFFRRAARQSRAFAQPWIFFRGASCCRHGGVGKTKIWIAVSACILLAFGLIYIKCFYVVASMMDESGKSHGDRKHHLSKESSCHDFYRHNRRLAQFVRLLTGSSDT